MEAASQRQAAKISGPEAFPGGPMVKNPPADAGDTGATLGRGTETPPSPCATTLEPTL